MQPSIGTWQQHDLRLPFTPPLCPDNLFGHLVATAVPGVEEWRDGTYRRTLRLSHGPGMAALRPEHDHIHATLWLTRSDDLDDAVRRCRHLLDLDADPHVIDAHLGTDPVLAPLVREAPGRRVPRTTDGAEMAIRMLLGQQISTRAARTHAGRLATAYGTPIEDPAGGLTRVFPTPEVLAHVPDAELAMPRSRRRAVRTLCEALTIDPSAGGLDLSPDADRAQARARLLSLRGIGPWTVEGVAMRALGDPDAFPGTDLGVARAMEALGLGPEATDRWRPWRAYAVQHLWATGDHEINRMPR